MERFTHFPNVTQLLSSRAGFETRPSDQDDTGELSTE